MSDQGVQWLAAALAKRDFLPNLKEVKVYKNQFGELGTQVCEGLKFLRKKIIVQHVEPSYLTSEKN